MGLTRLILAPFFVGVMVACALSYLEPTAEALECVSDEFWVVGEVVVEGQAISWPNDGHLYPGRLSLWSEGYLVEVEYAR